MNSELEVIERDFEPEELSACQISRELLKLGLPMAASFTFTLTLITIAAMTAQLPDENREPEKYLAATTLITSLLNSISTLAMSPLFSIGILASAKAGRLKRKSVRNNALKRQRIHEEIAHIFRSGIATAVLITPLPLFALYFSKPLLINAFKQDESIAELASQTLKAYSFASAGFLLRLVAEQILFTFQKNLPAMFISWGGFAAGTGLAYLFAFPLKMGLAGIGYGYLAEAWLTAIGFFILLAKSKDFRDTPLFERFRPNRDFFRQLKKVIQTGLPISLQMFSDLAASFSIGIFAGWLGQDQLAAQNFVTQLFIFCIIPAFAFSQTLSQMVSRQIGAKDYHNAMRVSRYGFLTITSLISSITILVAIFPQILTRIFSSSIGHRAATLAGGIMPLASAQSIYDAAGITMIQTLRSKGDFYLPMFMKIIGLISGIGIAYALGFNSYIDIYGIDIGSLAGIAIGTLMILPLWICNTSSVEIALSQEEKPAFASALQNFSFFEKASDSESNVRLLTMDAI